MDFIYAGNTHPLRLKINPPPMECVIVPTPLSMPGGGPNFLKQKNK